MNAPNKTQSRRATKSQRSESSPDDSPRAPQSDRWFIGAFAVLTLLGLGLRILGARGDLWVDEIWSLDIARMATSPWALLSLHTDNNHLLNTLLMYAMRDSQWMFGFRIQAIVFGAGSIVLAGVLAKRRGAPTAVFTMLLMACSFVMVHYGSEARGYSMLVFFFLAATIVLDRGLDKPSIGSAALFWVCCILATLSHSLFVQGYGALLAWSAWRLWFTQRKASTQSAHKWTWGKSLRIALLYHAMPMCVIVALYVAFMRHLGVMGASTSPAWEAIRQTSAYALGMPTAGAWGTAALIVTCAVLTAATVIVARRKDDRWVLLVTAIVVAPTLVVLLTSPEFLLARYFIIPIAMVQVALGIVLGCLWNARGALRVTGVAAAAMLLIGNSMNTATLLRNGRGQYSLAMRYIAEHETQPVVRIGGDHDRRQSTIVKFFGAREMPGAAIEYVPSKTLATENPEWLLLHRWGDDKAPGNSVTFDFVHRYVLRGEYPASPLGGWKTLVYQRETPATQPAQ